jgi:DNA-directed RNA polymerase specialized sigma24 family protein
MSPEEFAQFLEYLSPDTEEAGRQYTRLHEKLVGFLKMKGVSETGKAADETLDRAAVKICAGTPVPNVQNYCLGIARNVASEWYRREQREKSAFLHFVDGLEDGSDEEVERIERLLKPCFKQLDGEEQELLLAYCRLLRGRARAEHRRQLAETMKTSVLALRMRVTRLRSVLSTCVEKRARDGLASI